MAAGDTPIQGTVVDGSDEPALRRAVDLAFDYRGDVTIVRRGAAPPVEGYVFDRRHAESLERSTLRMIPRDGSAAVRIALSEIARLEFTGRDTAAGKSFETWVRKYVERKLAGQEASIEAEPLEGA